MPIKATDVRRGQALMYDGQLHMVLDTDHAFSSQRIALARAVVDWLTTACR